MLILDCITINSAKFEVLKLPLLRVKLLIVEVHFRNSSQP